MSNTIQFDQVADLYDHYVVSDFDLSFFKKEAAATNGDVLELTSGTGRVSIPLLRDGVSLTCVDYSKKMLVQLKKKLRKEKLDCHVVQMDITQLALNKQYDLIFIPFHSLSEVIEPEKHAAVLRNIYTHLKDDGTFICTLQNPAFRRKNIDGELHLLGEMAMPKGRRVFISSVLSYDTVSHNVSGAQFYEIYDKNNRLREKRVLDMKFHLFDKQEFESLFQKAGFAVEALYGDYHCNDFDEANSPFMIWKLKKSS